MTENLAGRGEGLAGLREALRGDMHALFARWAEQDDDQGMRAGVWALIERALEAAAPASTAHADVLSWRCIGLVLSREHRDLIVDALRAKYPTYGAGKTLSYPETLDVVSAAFRELEELCSEKVRALATPSPQAPQEDK